MTLSVLSHAARRRRPARLVAGLAMLGLVAGSLLGTSTTAEAAVAGPPKSFAGSGFGAIPDATVNNTAGSPRDVSFAVAGLTGPLTDVRVQGLTFNPAHTYVGDVTATLIAPNGTSAVLFGLTGNGGDSANIAGPYTFADDATGNWWTAADALGDNDTVPAGSYRTSQLGSPSNTANPTTTGAVTGLTAAFAGVSSPNGTWTLRLTDSYTGDTGTVSAATLVLRSDCAGPQAAVAQAQARATTAAAVVAAQAASVNKAAAKLKKAKKSTKPAEVKKKKVKKAKKQLKAARRSLLIAQVGQNTATAALTTAQAASTACTT